MFLNKKPSVVTRILDFADCSTHSTIHDVQMYPIYYDALYFPQFHPHVYVSPSNFCLWLQVSLVSHCVGCARCCRLNALVTVLFDGVSLSVGLDGLHHTFARSYFESETYTHCSVFCRFAAACFVLPPTAASLVTLRQHDDPPWFHYEDAHYHGSLQSLMAPHLRSIALNLASCKMSSRTEKNATVVILDHFFTRCERKNLARLNRLVPLILNCKGS
jgi:hypothetical protein